MFECWEHFEQEKMARHIWPINKSYLINGKREVNVQEVIRCMEIDIFHLQAALILQLKNASVPSREDFRCLAK